MPIILSIDTNWIEENIFLHKLNRAEQSLLDDIFETSTYNVGDEIISQGDCRRVIYILRSGFVDITQKNNGKSVHLGYVCEGGLFGEMSFLTEKPASATVTAHKDCLVYKLSLDGYCKLISQNQELLLSLFTYILNHSSDLLRQMNHQYAAQV